MKKPPGNPGEIIPCCCGVAGICNGCHPGELGLPGADTRGELITGCCPYFELGEGGIEFGDFEGDGLIKPPENAGLEGPIEC